MKLSLKGLKPALLLALPLMAGSSSASTLFGITSDGNSTPYEIENVRSIKFAPQKVGDQGYSVIKFNMTSTGFETGGADSIIVYPNPVAEYLNITGIDENETVVVTNTTGTDVVRTSGSRVAVDALPSGIYFLKVKGKTVKFVKK